VVIFIQEKNVSASGLLTKKTKREAGDRRKEAGKSRATKLDNIRCGMRLFCGVFVKDGTVRMFLPTNKCSKHSKKGILYKNVTFQKVMEKDKEFHREELFWLQKEPRMDTNFH